MNKLLIELNRDYVKKEINKKVDKFFDEMKSLSLKNEGLKKENILLKKSNVKLARAYVREIGLILTQKEYNKKFGDLEFIRRKKLK